MRVRECVHVHERHMQVCASLFSVFVNVIDGG